MKLQKYYIFKAKFIFLSLMIKANHHGVNVISLNHILYIYKKKS